VHIRNESWSEGPSIPVATYFVATAAATFTKGGEQASAIFAAGGCTENSCIPTASVYMLRTDTNAATWETVANMSTARVGFGLAGLGGKIYAIGGSADGEAGKSLLSSAEMFDPATNKWSPIASMKTARFNLALAASDDALYVVGGNDGFDTLTTTEKYDPSTNTWTAIASMRQKRCRHGAGVMDGHLYAVGGYDGNGDIYSSSEMLSLAKGGDESWTEAPRLNGKRDNCGVAVAAGANGTAAMYVLGGFGSHGDHALRSAEVLTSE
jgi:N-acetylneuraminic acid mutarotase